MSRPDRLISLCSNAMLAGGVAVAIALLARMFHFSGYGFDFTDEGFYLLSIASPLKFWPSITQFGLIYHPFYQLVNGDVVALRMLNVASIFTMSALLSYLCLRAVFSDQLGPKYMTGFLSLCLGSTSLVFFSKWLLTPSYNSLALQSLLLVAIGLLLTDGRTKTTYVSGAFLIGVGGWLAFMAKPTSAAALSVVVLLYLLLRWKRFWTVLLLAAGVSAVLSAATVFSVDGTVDRFFARITSAVELARVLNAGHEIRNIVRLDPVRLSTGVVLALLGTMFCYLLVFLRLPGPRWREAALRFACSALLLGWGFLFSFVFLDYPHWLTAVLSYRNEDIVYVVVFAAVLCATLVLRVSKPRELTRALPFFAMPYVFALGTSGNYWQQGSLAAIFWVLGAVLLIGPSVAASRPIAVLLPFALSAQAVTAAMLLGGLDEPYRQPRPLFENRSFAEIGLSGGLVIVPDDFARYIGDARAAVQSAEMPPETAIIDLSGQSPGLIFAVGARSLGLPWLVGGLPGSTQFAQQVLKTVPCEDLARAWILTEPSGPRSVPSEVLDAVGAKFPTDYRLVASWNVASGAGGFLVRARQHLYRPEVADTISEACGKARSFMTARGPG